MDPGSRAGRGSRRGLPRSRGDGPGSSVAPLIIVAAPPLTRGWTHVGLAVVADLVGSPAHAGMDPRDRQRPNQAEWLPRSRGDGPRQGRARLRASRAPPLTRGWTVRGGMLALQAAGSPAHAGMDLPPTWRHGKRVGLPRSRGDGPHDRSSSACRAKAPPLTRGWTRLARVQSADVWGSPAHAGMDPDAAVVISAWFGLPRSRGDGPICLIPRRKRRRAPPLTRGWTPPIRAIRRTVRGSPAHAGMDPARSRTSSGSTRLPRSRGDGPAPTGPLPCRGWAPPLTRGWTPTRRAKRLSKSGSPAHAGMDPCQTTPSTRC